MADYHPLIARAVEGLGTSTGEARRGLYERARAALVAQLRAIEPALSEADITRERLALEDAIRKVEAESVRKARSEPRPAAPPLRPPPPAARPQAAPPPVPPPSPPRRERPILPSEETAPLQTDAASADAQRFEPPPPQQGAELGNDGSTATLSARERLLNARTSPLKREGLRGLRDVVGEVDDLGTATAKAARSARDTRASYGTAAPQQTGDDDDLLLPDRRIEPHFGDDEALPHDDELRTLEPSYDLEDDEAQPFPRPRAREQEEEFHEPRPPRSYRGIARLAVVLIILAGLTATISWQWSNINALYHFVSHMRSRPSQNAQTPAAEPKFPGRVPQEQAGQAPGAAGTAPANQAGPTVAQRVVLYEEDQNDPQGKRFVGSAVWRTETVSPGPGLAPELAVRADIEVPDRHMTVTFSLRRNTDQALPASHTIEIMFNLPPDFPGGGVANVPGVLMKQSEQARGTPLAGLAVKVTNGFFLIGLSAVDADVQRNIQLLKDRPWFDIPIVYTSGGRAILALEKGPPGERALADAFAAWGK
jgi:hypothetical protein